ncbi:transposase family protein [Thalassobacillus sp. C254]|uniref:transposase family protein n=1 Tax=Thalassobacillus sp. C254 TaxID=1225341 RepID=UPI0006CFC2D4|nr:transposase family protein [Thalassobacillus sp. C254]
MKKEVLAMFSHSLNYKPIEGMNILSLTETEEDIEVIAEMKEKTARCPTCHEVTDKRHSRYPRLVRDLSINGKTVSLLLMTRKWFCHSAACEVKVFTERVEGVSPYQRKTDRLQELLRELAFSMSAKAAERISIPSAPPLAMIRFSI